ncbi:hypothetical protein ACSQ67_018593 [Phaseolus vulgaris]
MLIVVVTIEDTVTKRTERWFVSNIFSGRGVEKHNKRLQEEYEEEMERVVSFCCYYRYLYTSFVFIVIDMNFALHFSNLRWKDLEEKERIRRMQSVFNRERNKYKRSYESWRENGHGAYHQHFQREDWYWKTDTSLENGGLIIKKLQERLETMHYHITTQCWVLAGSNIAVHNIEIKEKETSLEKRHIQMLRSR